MPMDPKDTTTEKNEFQLSAEFERAIMEREIKRRERMAELQEEQPGACEPDELGTCDVCSG
jgi:hypothetical protein